MDAIEKHYGAAACKRYSDVDRYIDDMLGFGEVDWSLFDYGMEHRDTTENPGVAVFLGMRVQQDETGLHLQHQPKGEGWKWRPQRF